MTQAGNEAAVGAVIDERNDAIGRGDARAAVAPLAMDAIVYDLQPPLAFAGDAARDVAGINEWLATWSTPPRVAFADRVIAVDGDLATAHGLSHLTGDKRADAAVDLWYRTTVVLRRRDGAWRIVHEHHSVPFLMDGSFKAAIDLQP